MLVTIRALTQNCRFRAGEIEVKQDHVLRIGRRNSCSCRFFDLAGCIKRARCMISARMPRPFLPAVDMCPNR